MSIEVVARTVANRCYTVGMCYRLPVLLITLFLAGCAHSGSSRVSVATASTAPAPIAVLPRPSTPAVEAVTITDDPLPVYRSPKVVKVTVAPYINAKGEAFPESTKYVFADEGGWNIEALRNPERAYIPADNVLKPRHAPGVEWGVVSPGSAQVSEFSLNLVSAPVRQLFDLEQVRLTGFFERTDEPRARQEADRLAGGTGKGVAVYDQDLGWIIVPESALAPAGWLNPTSSVVLPARTSDMR